MKKYFLISLLIFSAISFTGCSTTNINYDRFAIERDIKQDINKIEDKNIKLVDSSPEFIIKGYDNSTSSMKIKYKLEASKINKEVSKEFFNQYFNLNSKEEPIFVVESKISDFYFIRENINSMRIDLTMDFKVTKNGKIILDKRYVKTAPGITYWEWRFTIHETTIKKAQKGVLSIYENEFKADLLKALKENK